MLKCGNEVYAKRPITEDPINKWLWLVQLGVDMKTAHDRVIVNRGPSNFQIPSNLKIEVLPL